MMNNRIKLCVFFLVLVNTPIALAKQLALTFDDAPRYANGYLSGPERAERLIKALKERDVAQVAFFASSFVLSEENLASKEGRQRLATYSRAGYFIANHSHAHENINQVSLEEFSASFLKAHYELQTFDNYKKWFRFPYLREGDTQQKRDGMRATLKSKGYQNAYITLNNYDWYIEALFQKALQQDKGLNINCVKQFYVDVMMESIDYYDKMAVQHLKRSPKHVLLLHETDISALFIGDLITALRKAGWQIISPEEAYKDPIAKYQTANIFKYNPGRIGEIAKDKGQSEGLWPELLNEKYLDKRFAAECPASSK